MEQDKLLPKKVKTALAKKPRKKARAPPMFPKKWLSDPKYKDWLRYDVQHNTMWCDFCRSSKIGGVWAEEGTRNFRSLIFTLQNMTNPAYF